VSSADLCLSGRVGSFEDVASNVSMLAVHDVEGRCGGLRGRCHGKFS
jgi:hypothetical protein